MIKRIISFILTVSFASIAVAGSPFDQVQQVQSQNEQRKAAAEEEKNRLAEAERLRMRTQAEEESRQKLRAAQNADRKAADAAKARNAEALRQRARKEKFEDEAQALALEEKRLDIEAKKAKVTRSNEYIDAELRAQAAKTDAIQSGADATRNVSSGTKALLEKTGEADVNRSNKWFE